MDNFRCTLCNGNFISLRGLTIHKQQEHCYSNYAHQNIDTSEYNDFENKSSSSSDKDTSSKNDDSNNSSSLSKSNSSNKNNKKINTRSWKKKDRNITKLKKGSTGT